MILGAPASGTGPLDPHMIEATSPRSGTDPVTGTALAPPGSPAGADPISGHEYTQATARRLEYACIFPLLKSRDCSAPAPSPATARDPLNDSPLCDPDPTKNNQRTLQVRAKAYPSLRQLQVIHDLGAAGHGVVDLPGPAERAGPARLRLPPGRPRAGGAGEPAGQQPTVEPRPGGRELTGLTSGTRRPAMSSPVSPASSWPRALAALLLLLGACVDQAAEHRVRANAFLRGGDAASALKECQEGLARKQGNVPLLILEGKALFELDRLDEARDAYQASLAAAAGEDGRSLAEAYLGLAMIASRQKDWPAARKHFETLVSVNGKDGSSHLNVAKDLPRAQGPRSAPSTTARRPARLRGNEEPVLYTLGTIYLAAGKPKEAELTFQHICEVIPGAASCPYGLALVAARAGDKPRCAQELDEAVRRKLPNPDQIGSDPGFSPIKDDPEFQKIAARALHP